MTGSKDGFHIFLAINVIAAITGVHSWGIKSSIQFEGKRIPSNPLFLPGFRYEYAERNTSADYGYWDEIGLKWVEWPGNITKLDLNYPILKWGKQRAKLVQNSCNKFLGMNFFAYAYEYLYLTFGPFRITTSYCPPLAIPRKTLPKTKSNSVFLTVSDFEFVPNYLLVIVEDLFVVRIGGLERSYRIEGTLVDYTKLVLFEVSKGITSPVDKLVTHNCCNKFDTCKTGDVVLAYKERSEDFIVFLSTDSGSNFKSIQLLTVSPILHAVLSYPTLNQLLAFHGDTYTLHFDTFSMETGKLITADRNATKNSSLEISGNVQARALGQEFSFLVWDNCRIWYSFNVGKSLTAANFYINSNLMKNQKKHTISPTHCFLADSTYYYDETGKFGLLDSMNNFLYGIDTKSTVFNLVATKLDMSLLLRGKENSITPFFDFNNRPKLMYPPKYLKVDHPAVEDENYKRRLGMRLFPKTIFPSDFMGPFYTENMPERYRFLGIQKCETSGLSADASITQKPKVYQVSERKPLKFQLEFRSQSNSSHQLRFEPPSEFLKIRMEILELVKMGFSDWYYFKYRISIQPVFHATLNVHYRLNFYTRKSLRCVHQPQLTVWVTVVENVEPTYDITQGQSDDSSRTSHGYLTPEKIKVDKNPMKIPSQCGGSGQLPVFQAQTGSL